MKFAISIVLLAAACIEGKALRYGARKEEASRILATDSMTLTADFGVYPDYTGGLIPSGHADVHFNVDGSFHIQLDISGVEADCAACGMHIHTGFTCDNATLVGPHYWNFDIFGSNTTDDPWNTFAFYASDGDGASTSSFEGDSGYDYDHNIGRAAVLHDSNGTRIGCGILEEVKYNTEDAVPMEDDEYHTSKSGKGDDEVYHISDASKSGKGKGAPRSGKGGTTGDDEYVAAAKSGKGGAKGSKGESKGQDEYASKLSKGGSKGKGKGGSKGKGKGGSKGKGKGGSKGKGKGGSKGKGKGGSKGKGKGGSKGKGKGGSKGKGKGDSKGKGGAKGSKGGSKGDDEYASKASKGGSKGKGKGHSKAGNDGEPEGDDYAPHVAKSGVTGNGDNHEDDGYAISKLGHHKGSKGSKASKGKGGSKGSKGSKGMGGSKGGKGSKGKGGSKGGKGDDEGDDYNR